MHHGIQVYEILENGNLLNAVYTNTSSLISGRYAIDNEIARKNPFSIAGGIVGRYECRYIETGNVSVQTGFLDIFQRDEVYEFTWTDETGVTVDWRGIGLMVGRDHIAVSYVKPPNH